MGPSSDLKRARVGGSDSFIAENLSLKLTSLELYEVDHNDLKRAFHNASSQSQWPLDVNQDPSYLDILGKGRKKDFCVVEMSS